MILDPYEVSDCLFAARRNLMRFESGLHFTAEDMRNLLEWLAITAMRAHELGNEIYRLQHIERVHNISAANRIISNEIKRPDTNVVSLVSVCLSSGEIQ
ncbi:hypothetical protein ABE527_17475 [Brucella sp. TWI432]